MIRTGRRMIAFGLGLAALALTAAAGPTDIEAKAKPGEAAPAWTLKDLNGKEHKLADFKGKTVVMEWTNPDCPFIKRVYDPKNGTVAETQKAMKAMGENFVYLAVDSSSRGITEAQVKERDAKFLKDHGMKHPVLLDHSGVVGKTYGAKTTPHMYVIDAKGVLRYHGAFTNDGAGTKGAAKTNYVINALKAIKAGETVAPNYERPWGCSVKYSG